MNYSDLMNLKDIYLYNIEEPEENHLRLLFERSKINPNKESIQMGNKIFDGLHSIEVDYSLPLIQLDFDSYIGYAIRNESYTSLDKYEQYEGKGFRIYSKSRFLDFINLSTFATEEYPGPFKHYGIVCLNHIIDVVSVCAPVIQEIRRPTLID